MSMQRGYAGWVLVTIQILYEPYIIDPDGMDVVETANSTTYTGDDIAAELGKLQGQADVQRVLQQTGSGGKNKKKKSAQNQVSLLTVKNAPHVRPISHWWEYVGSFLNGGRDVNGINYDDDGNPVHVSYDKMEINPPFGPASDLEALSQLSVEEN